MPRTTSLINSVGRALLALGLSLLVAAYAGASEIPRASRLDENAAALTVLVFTRADCHYCTIVKRDYLQALHDDARFRGRLVVREVRQDTDWPLTDFRGNQTTHRRFAQAHGITLVPVVSFQSRAGLPLTEPIVGARLGDFYQSYLDEAIRTALTGTRNEDQRSAR